MEMILYHRLSLWLKENQKYINLRRENRHIATTTDIKYNWLTDFGLLVKTRLTLMVVLTSVLAYVIASGFTVNFVQVFFLGLGGFLVAGASNILNEVLEKDYDKLMRRTQNRPLATGRMTVSNGVLLAGLMTLAGLSILGMFNPLTAFFGTLSLVTYAFIYTPLKRHSSVSVLIGAIPGALPMLIGCVAFDGYVSSLALLLFAIQFLWQFTHFWAIGVLSFDDYQRAGYQIIPESDGKPAVRIRWQAFGAALSLVPLSYLAYTILDTNTISLALLIAASLGFSFYAWRFVQNKVEKNALHLMLASLVYLPFVLSVLMIDQIL